MFRQSIFLLGVRSSARWFGSACLFVALLTAPLFSDLNHSILFMGGEAGPTQGDDGDAYDHLVQLGYNITYMDSDDTTTAIGATFDLIITSSTPGSGSMRGKFQNLPVPILNWEEALTRSNGGATNFQMSAESNANVSLSPPTVEIVDADHKLAAGFPLGELEIGTEPFEGAWGRGLAPDAVTIAEDPRNPDNKLIFFIPEGGELEDGSIAAGTRLNFPLRDTGFGVLNDNGLALFDAAVDWLIHGDGPVEPFDINGGGETYSQDFDEALGLKTGRLPKGWRGVTEEGDSNRIDGLGLTDGFLTVPNDGDVVLGLLNLGGNEGSFGPAPDGFVPTWTAELGGDNNLFGRDDVIADNAGDRALGVSRENNDHAGELNFEIEIAGGNLRAFVLDWDLEIWGGDPDGAFRSAEGPGMKVDVLVGGTSYSTMTENLNPGPKFDSLEDESGSDHNATLIDGNAHSVRGISSGIKEVSDADGAVGNMIQVNFNSNWNGATDGDANGWISAIDNVRLRALAPGDADANGVVDVADLLQLLGGQKFNQGVDGVTWEQGDFNADDQFNTGDLLAMLSFLSGTFPSDPYASEAGGASDAVADIIVNSETGEVTVDLAGHTVSAVIIESASEIFSGEQPDWDTTSQFPSTLPGELGNVLFTSTAAGVDELGAVISAEFLGRDKEFYLQDLDLNILIASEGGALTKGNVIVVPEPSTWLMLGLGSLLLVGWRQAKRSPGRE